MCKKVFLCIFVFFLILFGAEIYDCLHQLDYFVPPYADLGEVAAKTVLSKEDYAFIFSQTGLGKPAVDDLKETSVDFFGALQEFQMQKQSPIYSKKEYLFFPIATAEVLTDEAGNFKYLTLPPLKKGDILLTKSTKSAIYRHGHAALVIDDGNRVAEAFMIGSNSDTASVAAWEAYATIMVLRPKAGQDTIDTAVNFARQKLIHVPYHLLTGVLDKDKSDNGHVNYTQCSHLVWQAYKAAGYDLDSDGSFLVTPADISACNDLELVYSFGFGESSTW